MDHHVVTLLAMTALVIANEQREYGNLTYDRRSPRRYTPRDDGFWDC